MNKLIAPLLAATLAGTASAPALVQAAASNPAAWPGKTITLVVPTAAGGANDAMARTIAQKLGPMLGQTLIIDNRAGANGSIASEYMARALPDGHTLMLTVAGPKRAPELPGVPTLKEAGVDGVDVTQWYAHFALAKTPPAVIVKLDKALNEVLADKDIIKRLEDHGADVQPITPKQLGTLVKDALAKWKRVVQAKLTAE